MTMKSGDGPADLVNLCLVEAAQMLKQSGKANSLREGIEMARAHLKNGKAFAKFREMVIRQGGDPEDERMALLVAQTLNPITLSDPALSGDVFG